jgi:hypothetical protein
MILGPKRRLPFSCGKGAQDWNLLLSSLQAFVVCRTVHYALGTSRRVPAWRAAQYKPDSYQEGFGL